MMSLSKAFLFVLLFWVASVQASELQRCKALNQGSLEACRSLAKEGNADGQFGLGMLLLEGTGVNQDLDRSFELMYEAAMQGHSAAQFQVGQAYVNGQGIKRDFEEGYAWLLVAKENGNPVATKGIQFMDSRNLVEQSRMNSVTQRANDLYGKTQNKSGFEYDESERSMTVEGLTEYCDMVMPTVDGIIAMKKYDKPQSEARQLMVGMTDDRAIKMMNGLVNWVWSTDIPVDNMSSAFKDKCLRQSEDIGFMFQ